MTTTAIATRLRRGVSRRAFLKTTAGTAALIGALKANFPAGVHIAQAAGPEVTKANLGFIALTDAGALFVAKDKGFFAKHGMGVRMCAPSMPLPSEPSTRLSRVAPQEACF